MPLPGLDITGHKYITLCVAKRVRLAFINSNANLKPYSRIKEDMKYGNELEY